MGKVGKESFVTSEKFTCGGGQGSWAREALGAVRREKKKETAEERRVPFANDACHLECGGEKREEDRERERDRGKRVPGRRARGRGLACVERRKEAGWSGWMGRVAGKREEAGEGDGQRERNAIRYIVEATERTKKIQREALPRQPFEGRSGQPLQTYSGKGCIAASHVGSRAYQ